MSLIIKFTTILAVVLFMSGCLYPEERLEQNQVPYKDQSVAVQVAVDQFEESNNGLLPIKTRDMTTPLYQKYPIDFNKLTPRYMQEPPSMAFENGGVYLFVLVNVETVPTVKLIDLRITEEIRNLNLRLNMYKQSNGYLPYKKVLAETIFLLDFEKLGYEQPPSVKSPFSGKNLPLLINHKDEIFVDYRMDLYEALQKNKNYTFKTGDDIRDLLVNNSMFVPVYSVPYTIDEKNDPIFLLN